MTADRAYATALEGVLGSTEALRAHATAFSDIANVLASEPAVRAFLERSDITPSDRVAVLRTAFGKRLPDTAYAFLALLMTRRALGRLADIAAACARRADAAAGTTDVIVTSARPLSPNTRTTIERAIAAATAREIHASYREDPALIAGLRVTVDGSRQWDGSIAGKLSQMIERLRVA